MRLISWLWFQSGSGVSYKYSSTHCAGLRRRKWSRSGYWKAWCFTNVRGDHPPVQAMTRPIYWLPVIRVYKYIISPGWLPSKFIPSTWSNFQRLQCRNTGLSVRLNPDQEISLIICRRRRYLALSEKKKNTENDFINKRLLKSIRTAKTIKFNLPSFQHLIILRKLWQGTPGVSDSPSGRPRPSLSTSTVALIYGLFMAN